MINSFCQSETLWNEGRTTVSGDQGRGVVTQRARRGKNTS